MPEPPSESSLLQALPQAGEAATTNESDGTCGKPKFAGDLFVRADGGFKEKHADHLCAACGQLRDRIPHGLLLLHLNQRLLCGDVVGWCFFGTRRLETCLLTCIPPMPQALVVARRHQPLWE